MTDPLDLDATAQAALVRRGDVTPVELVAGAIARAEQRNPALNAIIHERYERASADAADPPSGPFRGVPIVVKDHDGPLAGEPYHSGNRLLKEIGYSADRDSYLIAALRRAGFVVIGKTNCPEFGLLPTSEPTAYGPTRNPWAMDRSPGGSSGGTGAAVAARIVALGHAGDGGGSIRIPASMGALFGLKPTRGRVSLGPDEGEAWSGLVARHVLTRSVRDSAAVLDLVSGTMPGDPYSLPAPPRPFLTAVRTAPGRLRIGVTVDAGAAGVLVEPECAAVTKTCAGVLESLGHTVEHAGPAALDDGAIAGAFLTLMSVGTATEVQRVARLAGRDVGPQDVEALSWLLAEQGRGVSASALVDALAAVHGWTRRVAHWWSDEGYDLLLTPTTAALPPPVGTVHGEDAEGALLGALPFAAFTAPFNLTGQPAASVPAGWSAHGLPIGVQLVAAAGREDLLLQVAGQLEEAQPWADRMPPSVTLDSRSVRD